MTGNLVTRKTSKNQEYYYVSLSYKDPSTRQWKTKMISTGLPVKNNKRKAQALIPDLIKKHAYLESEVLTKTHIDRNITLCDYLDRWLKGKKGEVRQVTYEGYAARIRSIKIYFEPLKLKLRAVTPADLDTYFKWCLSYGKCSQKTGERMPLSVRSTRGYKSILSAAFDQAIIDGVVESNPVTRVRVHGKKNRDYAEEYLFLTREELSDLIHFLEREEPRFTAIAFIAAYYGLRRSELLALRWDAIDFKKHTLSIRRSIVRVTTVMESDMTKTPAGRRTLVLFPMAEKCLLRLKAEQKENAAFYGNTYQNTRGYVFTWEDGRCYDPDFISTKFAKLTKAFGRPEITLHKLRHTCISLLSELGWDLKKIQYWCGHADFSTTANIYMHFNRQRLNGAADDLSIISEDCADIFQKESISVV